MNFRTTFLLASAAPAAVMAQTPMAIRPVGKIVATSESMPSITTVRPLPNGKVIANDGSGKKVVMFDSTLAHYSIIADTTSGTHKAYGAQSGGIMPYVGDSTLFLDQASLSFQVISPNGTIVHSMSVPDAQDVFGLLVGGGGAPGFDPRGRMIYKQPPGRAMMNGMRAMMAAQASGATNAGPPPSPDSTPIVRFDVATRKFDTVTKVKQQATTFAPNTTGGFTSIRNPLPLNDDWALLPDGSVAVIRAQDYHIDRVDPSGKVTSLPKVAHEWERLNDDRKTAILDSVKVADSISMKGLIDNLKNGGGNQRVITSTDGGPVAIGGSGGPPGGGGQGMTFVMANGPAGGGGPAQTVSMSTNGGSGGLPGALNLSSLPAPLYVAATDLPDYWPALIPGSARADLNGNLWVRIYAPASAGVGQVFDVIDPKTGKTVDRVQLPGGTQLVGFGKGCVYLTSRTGTGVQLAKALLH